MLSLFPLRPRNACPGWSRPASNTRSWLLWTVSGEEGAAGGYVSADQPRGVRCADRAGLECFFMSPRTDVLRGFFVKGVVKNNFIWKQ